MKGILKFHNSRFLSFKDSWMSQSVHNRGISLVQ